MARKRPKYEPYRIVDIPDADGIMVPTRVPLERVYPTRRPGSSDDPPPPPPFDPEPEPEVIPPRISHEPAISLEMLQAVENALKEKARRATEGLRLYEPTPVQEAFHKSRAKERVVRGGNRAGKTLCAAAEIARAVTGQDPHEKYPKHDGRCYIVGWDGKFLGEVIYRKLFRSGAFWVIKDQATGKWRPWKPWLPHDLKRKHERKQAPPLIPPRMVAEVAWENKGQGIPNIVRLKNGWEIAFFSNNARPAQGMDIDLFWFDEECSGEWYREAAARLIDRGGRFIWSATPQVGTEQLYTLHERALEQVTQPPELRSVEEFLLPQAVNPYLSEAERREFESKITSEEERSVRVDGEFMYNRFRVYPEFNMSVHGIDPFPIPHDWTRYVAIDPGVAVFAAVFLAVPPPGHEKGDHWFLYDEMHIRDAHVQKFADAFMRRVDGQSIHELLIDHQKGRQTEVGSGRNVEELLSSALRERKFHAAATGTGFVWGFSDIEAGIDSVRAAMRIRSDGTPKLKVFSRTLSKLEHEIKHYHMGRDPKTGLVTGKPVQKNNDICDCVRYLVCRSPEYHRPQPKHARELSGVHKWLAEKKRRANQRNPMPRGISLGPGV
jgi:hypothetical protein